MKKLIPLLVLLFLFSCKEKSENAVVATENSNIISSVDSKSFSRYSKGGSLIDAIYFEMIKDDEKLKSLDDQILKLRNNSYHLISQKKELLQKPSIYFQEANERISLLKDSMLKKEMEDHIQESYRQFSKKRENLEKIEKQIGKNAQKINDFYNAFKIKKTLPEIEKYQNQNPLKLEELHQLISEQSQLIEQLKK